MAELCVRKLVDVSEHVGLNFFFKENKKKKENQNSDVSNK